MATRIEILENAYALIDEYTKLGEWRAGLVDIFVYHYLIEMHQEDYYDADNQEWIWSDTPDHIMEKIIADGPNFDLEWGPQDLWDFLRDYLHDNNHIKHIDDEEENNDN